MRDRSIPRFLAGRLELGLLALGVVVAGCGSGSSHSSGFVGASTAAATSAARPSATGATSSASATTPRGTTTPGSSSTPAPSPSASPAPSTNAGPTVPAPPATAPRVALTPRGLSIGGQVRPLLGGEVQYFRVRDPAWDVAKTYALWEKALDDAQAAGVTLVSTYVPWDFHEESEGHFDFSGVKDLDHFLELCWKRGLAVSLKPGPFTNAEWPNGLGSYGAVPEWWKMKHPGSLALKPDGTPFSFDLIGRPEGRQPSYFDPDFRASAVKWFTALAPIVHRYIVDRPTIAIVQIDNETDYYFKSRFSVDYSPQGIAQYRGWLTQKYGSIAALNAAYGTTYSSFDDVKAPTKKADHPDGNLAVQDWFDAGKDGTAEYQLFLRHAWEQLGIQEPWVLFTTNDSPHAMPSMDIMLWDGPTKNKAGLASIDAYPKQFPWSLDKPSDYPFLTSFFTKRFIEANGDYSFAGGAPQKMRGGFAAELEGGLFSLPLGLPLEIPARATDAVLLEFYGHGGVAGAIYAFRGGLNRDGSPYFTTACVDPFGNKTARYDVAARFGNGLLAGQHGQELIASSDVEAPVALVVGARFDAPMADVAGHPGWIQAKEAPAVYGWLEDAGTEPVVLDGRRVHPGDLDRFQLVVYVDPDATDDDLAQALDGYVRKGGTLLNLMHPGRHDGSWRSTGVGPSLLAGGLFADGVLSSVYEETLGFAFPPHVNLALPNGFAGDLATSSFEGLYDVTGAASVFAHDRTAPFGVDGKVTGWSATKGSGQVLFLGTNPARAFRDCGYYEADAKGDILTARALARWIASQAGVQPTLEVADAKAQAFARAVDAAHGGGCFLFLGSRLQQDDTATVKLLDLAPLGLDAATTYRLTDVLSGTSLGSFSGATLQASGASVPLPAFGSAVVRVQ